MDPVDLAASIVTERFPTAVAALLAGSVARGSASATSDLDIVVVLDGPPAPFRETIRVGRRPVELFVHTTASLTHWYERDRTRLRNTLADMVISGLPLVGHNFASTLKSEAADIVKAGPPQLTQVEWDDRRYFLTDALDDLAGAQDPAERDAIAGLVMMQSAEFALLTHRQWLGSGKWLIRRLRELDVDLAERLANAHRRCVADGQAVDLVAIADQILQPAGGRLVAGYRRS